jgi:hypothetical protein
MGACQVSWRVLGERGMLDHLAYTPPVPLEACIQTLCRKLIRNLAKLQQSPTLSPSRCHSHFTPAGEVVPMSDSTRQELQESVVAMSSRGLRCICLAMADISADEIRR